MRHTCAGTCSGYDAGVEEGKAELRSRLAEAEDALRFYADRETWSQKHMLCGSDRMRDDLEDTDWSRFTPGKRARAYLEKHGGK